MRKDLNRHLTQKMCLSEYAPENMFSIIQCWGKDAAHLRAASFTAVRMQNRSQWKTPWQCRTKGNKYTAQYSSSGAFLIVAKNLENQDSLY